MSSTSTVTATSQEDHRSAAPEITIINRVAAIPMIHSSLLTLDDVLATNALTRSPYNAAKGLSLSAIKYTEPLAEPILVRLAPLLTRADNIANKAVDVVEQRYPYPFKAKPEEVATYVREKKQDASTTVNEKLVNPAYSVVQGIDQRFTPIVNYFEEAVHKLNSSEAGQSPNGTDAKYQYQRAIALSKDLKDHIYGYSHDQLTQIQAHSALLQRATETASSISNLAASSISTAQTHIHTLSDNMLTELQKVQSSMAAFSSSVQTSAKNSFQHNIPQTYSELTSNLSTVIGELTATVMEKDLPIQEKVTRVGQQVRESISPLLETLKKGAEGLLAAAKNTANEADEKAVEVEVKVEQTTESESY